MIYTETDLYVCNFMSLPFDISNPENTVGKKFENINIVKSLVYILNSDFEIIRG